jgi:glyoxylate carboligase
MAEAYGKLTGKPGICFVTRGPGATNASIGVHTAFQDSTPMILFIGQVGTDFMDREAFQEIDYRRMYGQMAKWVAQIDRADRIPEYIARAFQVATSGRPGPVVLALPEDMLVAQARVADTRRYQPVQAAPSAGQIDNCAACWPAPEAAAAAGRRHLERAGLRRRADASPKRTRCRWPAPSASRTCWTTRTRTTPATSASASIRSWPRA